MVWDEVTNSPTDQYFVSTNGNKMLSGKVELPFVAKAVESVVEKSTQKPEFEDDVPF